MTPERTAIYGPPGTGKTTYILRRLEEDFATYKPYEIAFVSFTNQGVDEGKYRAIDKFGLKEKDLPYFGTIHSLCFKALRLSREHVLSKRHYRLFSEKTGIDFCGHYTEDYSSPNDAYLHAVEMKRQNPAIFERMMHDLNMNEIQYEFIETEIGRLKEQLNLMDFTDMLTGYMDRGDPIPVRLAYIDEAQDLTQLQWEVVLKMFSGADKIVVAGDDDQAVYEWAGADVNRFINFTENKVMLKQSYRMPIVIHALARNIIKELSIRQEKQLLPKNEEGVIDMKRQLLDVDLLGGELILARTKYILRELSRQLMDQGYLFSFKGKSSVDMNILSAIMSYRKYLSGEITEMKPAHKGMFAAVSKDYDWYDVLKQSEFTTNYYRRLIDTKGYTRENIEMETFHGSKGAENSHVILATDTSKRVEDMRLIYPDMELRCLFVGVTRSSNKLTILAPTRQHHCPMDLLTVWQPNNHRGDSDD